MKFSAVAVATLASGVLADIKTISSAVDTVGQNIEGLDSALKSFSGNPQPVQDAADKLVAALQEAKSKVEGSGQLELSDAIGLQEPVKGLQAKSEQLVKDLKTGKPIIEQKGFCSLVRSKVSAINSGSSDLIKAVVSKVPADAQTIAASLAAPLKKSLAEANEQFSESNCKGGKGGSSSAPASSAPASSAPASSAPASSGPAYSQPSAPASSAAPSSSEEASAPASSAPASTGYQVPSGGNTTPYQPTGTGVPTGAPTTQPPMVTAGAAIVAPAGVLALAAAALML